jgi:hypothetical protein
MTKKLEELFELPQNEANDIVFEPTRSEPISEDTLDNIEKIEKALPQVKGLEASDAEMDELAELATNSYKDLIDLGMQVDSRFSAEIFGVASNMLNHAITAKTAKMNKKLKMIELQLKKATLDQKISSQSQELDNTPIGSGQALDRNELLKILNAKTTDK